MSAACSRKPVPAARPISSRWSPDFPPRWWPDAQRLCANLVDKKPYIHNSGYMESENVILALAALAQSTRLDVFRLLVKHKPQALAASYHTRPLPVPANTTSSHLSLLSP